MSPTVSLLLAPAPRAVRKDGALRVQVVWRPRRSVPTRVAIKDSRWDFLRVEKVLGVRTMESVLESLRRRVCSSAFELSRSFSTRELPGNSRLDIRISKTRIAACPWGPAGSASPRRRSRSGCACRAPTAASSRSPASPTIYSSVSFWHTTPPLFPSRECT